jgi:hypothetical protein
MHVALRIDQHGGGKFAPVEPSAHFIALVHEHQVQGNLPWGPCGQCRGMLTRHEIANLRGSTDSRSDGNTQCHAHSPPAFGHFRASPAGKCTSPYPAPYSSWPINRYRLPSDPTPGAHPLPEHRTSKSRCPTLLHTFTTALDFGRWTLGVGRS